jgi:hypothetical protein
MKLRQNVEELWNVLENELPLRLEDMHLAT